MWYWNRHSAAQPIVSPQCFPIDLKLSGCCHGNFHRGQILPITPPLPKKGMSSWGVDLPGMKALIVLSLLTHRTLGLRTPSGIAKVVESGSVLCWYNEWLALGPLLSPLPWHTSQCSQSLALCLQTAAYLGLSYSPRVSTYQPYPCLVSKQSSPMLSNQTTTDFINYITPPHLGHVLLRNPWMCLYLQAMLWIWP